MGVSLIEPNLRLLHAKRANQRLDQETYNGDQTKAMAESLL